MLYCRFCIIFLFYSLCCFSGFCRFRHFIDTFNHCICKRLIDLSISSDDLLIISKELYFYSLRCIPCQLRLIGIKLRSCDGVCKSLQRLIFRRFRIRSCFRFHCICAELCYRNVIPIRHSFAIALHIQTNFFCPYWRI